MSKVVQRLLTFFIGIPLVIGLVCLRQYNHLALHIALFLFSVGAALELHGIFSHHGSLQKKAFVACMAVLPLAAAYLSACGLLSTKSIEYTFLAAIMICMATEVVTAQSFEHSNTRLMSSTFIILYCGYFPAYISRMTTLPHATECIALFLLLVFMCDSIAWLFGNLFGKNNRGIFKASPNKSVAGFIGGLAGSSCISLLAWHTLPTIFGESPVKALLLGLLIALCAIIGDLTESVFKRSADCKDSGSIIPGRGGILDSIDSIFFAAPIYYFVTTLFC